VAAINVSVGDINMSELDNDHLGQGTNIGRLRRAAENELDILPESSPIRHWLADEVDELAEEEATASGGRLPDGRGDDPPIDQD
jgi:hypothetical protein